MKGALGCVALGCALGAANAKVVKWGRDANQESWTPPQQTLGVMPELFNGNLAPLPTPAPLVPKRAFEKRGATDNTCAYVSGSTERSLYCDTTAFCASNSLNSHVGCCDDTASKSCTVWTTCLALSESAKYTTNNGLTLWCGFTDYPNCITHIYHDSTAKASVLSGYTLLGCAVAAGTDKVYYNAFTSSSSKSSATSINLTPKASSSSSPDIQNIPSNPQTPQTPNQPSNPNGGGGGGVVSQLTTLYDTITAANGVVYTTATATATVAAGGIVSGGTTSSGSAPVGAIAGGVVGGVAGIALIALAIWYLVRRKSAGAKAESPGFSTPPQPTIPAVAQVQPPPPNGYYGAAAGAGAAAAAGGFAAAAGHQRESTHKPSYLAYENVSPSQSPPPPQSPISPYQQSTPSPPPPSSNGHFSMYSNAGAAGAGAAAGYAAGAYGGQQQQGYPNQQPPQGYQGYQNQAPGYGYQQQHPHPQQGYPQQGQYPPPQQQPYPHGGYAPPPGQHGYVMELPTQRGDGEVREMQG